MAHSFTELKGLWPMWLDGLVFCDCSFHSVCPLMEKIRGFLKLPGGRDWLSGKLGLVLMSGAMLNTSLIQFSGDGWPVFPLHCLIWGQTFQLSNANPKILYRESAALNIASKYGKLSRGHRTGKGQLSFQYQRKAMPKNAQTMHNCTHLTR